MPTSSAGHRQDVRPKKVQIDEELWRKCKLWKPGRPLEGCQVRVIDGNAVMVSHDMDFTQGANGLEDPKLCSRNELILDDTVVKQCWPFILYHEAFERRKMIAGWSYDKAHKLANDHERQLRRLYYGKL